MSDLRFDSPIPAGDHRGPFLAVSDATAGTKTRFVGDDLLGVPVGRAVRSDDAIVFSTSPGEWTALGALQAPDLVSVDLTHVRAVIHVSGGDARRLLAKVCSLDLGDHMFPAGSAARTSIAGTATELVRFPAEPDSYLLITSRSFAEYLHGVLVEQAREYLESVPST